MNSIENVGKSPWALLGLLLPPLAALCAEAPPVTRSTPPTHNPVDRRRSTRCRDRTEEKHGVNWIALDLLLGAETPCWQDDYLDEAQMLLRFVLKFERAALAGEWASRPPLWQERLALIVVAGNRVIADDLAREVLRHGHPRAGVLLALALAECPGWRPEREDRVALRRLAGSAGRASSAIIRAFADRAVIR